MPNSRKPEHAKQAQQAPGAAGDVVGPKSLLAEDAAKIQGIAEKYQTRIDVGGSPAIGEGRNIDQFDMPVDKGQGTRSGIDYIVDPDHPQFQQIMAELREVGGGAGSLHPDSD